MKPLTRREFLDVSAKGIAGAALGAGVIDELVNPNVAQAAGSANTNKSGVAEQVISLPKGGGAIKGLGEKFQPDLHTGTGNFTVPVQLPPGRSGFQPELALSYSTGAGNGAFGLGWEIGIPNVSRQTSKGVPTYDDKQDTFILSGAEDLVPVDDGYYQPRTEGLFARIRKIASPVDGQDCWEVTSKKNIHSYYGLDDNARVFTVENGRKKVFKWLLSQTADPCGNTILYHYQRDTKPEHFDDPAIQRTEANHEYHQVYLVEIAYMNFRETGDNDDQYFVRVQFDSGQFNDDGSAKTDSGTASWAFRPDRFSSYRAGFEIRTVRRCKRILIKVRDEKQKDVYLLAKSYNLEYLPSDPAKRYSNLSLLTSVTLQGYRNGETKSFPPLIFGYTEFWPQDRVFENFTAPAGSLPDRPLSDPNYELIDLTGNGLPDVIHTSRYGFRFWKNMCNCQFVGPIAMRQAPAGVLLEQPGVQFADMQGNGRADLLVTGGISSGYYETTYGEESEWERFHPYTQAPDFAFEDPNVRLVDMDGDGVIDVLRTDTRAFMYFRNHSENGFAAPQPVPRQHDMETFPDVYFSDPRVHLADMSGDGLQDIVFIHDRRIEYWPNLGRGRWGKRILMANAPDLHDGNGPNGQYDPKRLFFSDVDGDGLADLVYVAYDSVKVWLNQSGNGWSAPLIIRGTPPTSAASVRLADMNGTGTAGVLWTYEPALFRGSHYKYLDFTGETKPYLLSAIDNNLGASTVVQYRPSTEFWIEDQKKAQPWLTHLPFPVQVVAKVEAIDHIAKSKLVTSYSYHHGYYDGREREFRGFGRAEQLDTETFDSYKTNHLHEGKIAQSLLPTPPDDWKKTLDGISYVPPVLSKTWFHPGIYVDEKKYLDKLRHEYYQGDSQAFAPHFQIETGDAPFEAYRALRGAVLRTEVYALDGTALEKHPYVVTENGYQVRQVYPKGKNSFGIFLTNLWETFTYHYERNPADPRIAHTLNHEIDAYSNVVKSLNLAYPRRKEGYPEQKKQHVIYANNRFINQDKSDQSYFIGVNCEAKQVEILLPEGMTYSPLQPDQIPLLDIDNPSHNLFSHVRNYYDGAAYEGLPLGEIGVQGMLTRSETLVLKKGQAAEVYGGRVTSDDFRSLEVGYVEDPKGSDNWWVRNQRMKYDATQHYLLVGQIDALGHESRIEYDRFAFLPVKSIDPIGNVISAENDYLVMSPWQVTDFNDNRSAVAFDPQGFVIRTAVMGKEGSSEGDRLDNDSTATTVIKYDLWQYKNEKKPIYAYVKAREEHHHLNPNPRSMETWVYSDGFGREIQTKAKAAPGEVNGIYCEKRWVGSGWKIYNNKGWVVEQYEPFFACTEAYEGNAIHGVSAKMTYDPLGRVIRTDSPDGTFSRTEFDPWKQTTYDPNDTVLASAWYAAMSQGTKQQQDAAKKAAKHANTPTVTHVDTLARTFLTIQHNADQGKYETKSAFDIQGNVLSMIDPCGNTAFQHKYDLAGNLIYRWQMDSGERFILLNAVGNPVKKWDSRNHIIESKYDILNRPTELSVTHEPPDGSKTRRLAEKMIYGEGQPEDKKFKLRGKIFQQYDGAGVVTFSLYDFKGNLKDKQQQILDNYKNEVDWSSDPAPALMTNLPQDSSFKYDALNRVVASITPDNSRTVQVYDEGGLLKGIRLFHRGSTKERAILKNVTYNAKSQGERIEYGNEVVTTYQYDPKNFRLTELKSHYESKVYQHYVYTYDPVGNITFKQNLSTRTACYDNAIITGDNDYTYDAINRLIAATGRELRSNTVHNKHEDPPYVECNSSNDTQALRPYRQEYSYDSAGNINLLVHIANGGSWRRHYEYDEHCNRLKKTFLGSNGELEFEYGFDAHGNHTNFSHLKKIDWDFKDQMQIVDCGGGGKAYYLYDTSGMRVRKVLENTSEKLQRETIYWQEFEIFKEYSGSLEQEVIESLHILGDKERVALIETRTLHNGMREEFRPKSRYQLADHLGSSVFELTEEMIPITFEEYFPYGGTAYCETNTTLPFSLKKYRYTGKEKDNETGFCYHGARYYSSWLCRWTNCDKIGLMTENNLYLYVLDSPILLTDRTGLLEESIELNKVDLRTPRDRSADLERSIASGEPIDPKDPSKQKIPSEDELFWKRIIDSLKRGIRLEPSTTVITDVWKGLYGTAKITGWWDKKVSPVEGQAFRILRKEGDWDEEDFYRVLREIVLKTIKPFDKFWETNFRMSLELHYFTPESLKVYGVPPGKFEADGIIRTYEDYKKYWSSRMNLDEKYLETFRNQILSELKTTNPKSTTYNFSVN